ncbi:hypothetical protein LOD99_12369 [Oopsacas minuta]|uniref:Kinesin motor domain-containing protein n=1 Tax=Oopsacas minuta TaxID=111878 RepID=A0AAV7JF05_9METZ|nr:hypothetical protein LOD99_12369 [Oopsacas minuta]
MPAIPVKVAVKIRPLNKRESHEKECTIITDAGDLKTLKLGKDGKLFTYDWVVDHTDSSLEFYKNSVSGLVTGLFDGFNATVLAYGQTGSGKTYSMGTSGKMADTAEENWGVVPRAARQIFQLIDAVEQKYYGMKYQPKILVDTQFLELYQDVIVDLYDHKNPIPPKIIQHPIDGIKVGSSVKAANSPEMIIDLLQKGAINRQVGGTLMNAESSRSHAIFIINITQKLPEFEKANDESKPDINELAAKFCLVDLAGSERLGKTGAEGGRKQEGISINKGLLSLGNVISALGSAKKKLHVNYRDTKLTFLLKDSLGGNSKTLMIACISPSAGEINETKNTLEYANRARNIKNTPKKNQDGASLQISLLKEQIEKLQNCLKRCTCGAAEGMQVEAEDEAEETADQLEDRSTSCDPDTLSVTPVPPSDTSTPCTPSNERLLPQHKSSVNPVAQYQEVQNFISLQKNEEMEATIKSLHLANKKISRQLADYKTRLDVNKIRYKVKDEDELDTKLTQLLHDSHLKNEELELEMYQRRKYYSLLNEYRKKKEVLFQRLESQPMTEDILSLAQEDIDKRKMFYESLPDYILKPKPKRKRKRSKHFKMSTQSRDFCPLPRQESMCLFNPTDFDNASTEAIAVMHKAEELHSTFISKQFFSKKKIYRRDSEVIKSIERKGSGALILDPNTHTSVEEVTSEQKASVHQVELGNQTRQEFVDNLQFSGADSMVQNDSSLVNASDNASTSGEGTIKQELEEQIHNAEQLHNAEQFRDRNGNDKKQSESNVEQQKSSLYSVSDYIDASGEVLAIIEKSKAQDDMKRARTSLKETQNSKSLSETKSNDEQEHSLYSASDWADASAEVLVMMQKAQVQHDRKRARTSLKETQDSKSLSEPKSNDEQEAPLYSASDWADASGEVLVMMQKAQVQHDRKRARASLKGTQDSKSLSDPKSNDEQEHSLYSASDWADASGEVLVMMHKAQVQHDRKRARTSLKGTQDSESLSEPKSNGEQETPLYSASDWADASGEVLVMMQKAQVQHDRKRARASLKETQDSKSLSEAKSNGEQETPLYSASDWADASGEVLVMMQKAQVQHDRKRARASLKETQDSKSLSEAKSNGEQDTPLYSASDWADASGEVLVMMQKAQVQHDRKRARASLKETQDSKSLSEAKSNDEQETPLYSASDWADASGEVLVMMQKAQVQHDRKRARASLKETQDSKSLSETISNDEQEHSLYSASDWADASGEVLVMMHKAQVQHDRKRAQKLLKEKEDSQREIDTTTSVQQQSQNTTHPSDDPDSPDEIFLKPVSRTTTKNSLRDVAISSNESEGSQSDLINTLHVIEEQYSEENSQQSQPKPAEICVPQQQIKSDNEEVGNFDLSETQPHPYGDLISSLPEEDQAVQGELINNAVTEGASVHFQESTIEGTHNEPVYPLHLDYFSSSDRDSYETDSDVEDLDPSDPNNTIWNPDVAAIMEDITIRKGLLVLIEKDKQHNVILTKQTRGRIRDLEGKIQVMEKEMDTNKYELRECKNKLKQGDAKTKLADFEKKVLKLTKDLEEEKKLAKRREAANKELYLAQGAKKWKEAFEKSEVERKALSASLKVTMHKMETIKIEQAKQIKTFEKRCEKEENINKDKVREMDKLVKRYKTEDGKKDKLIEDSKKKVTSITQECSKLSIDLKETKSTLTKKIKELTKNVSALTAASKKEKKATSPGKTNVKKMGPPRVPSLRESKEQSEKDRAQSIEIIEKMVTHLLNKSEVSQQIRMMVEKRVIQQVTAKKKELLKKPTPSKKSQREVYKGYGPGKDVKAILPEVKRVIGSRIPEEVANYVTPMDERRAKRALELLFLCLIYDGVVNKVKLLEEEQLNCAMKQLSESVTKMEEIKDFIENQIILSKDNLDTTRIRRCYSTDDSTYVKLISKNNLITQSEEKSSPQISQKLKCNSANKPVLGSNPAPCSAISKRLNPPTNTSNTNLKSSMIKPSSRSAIQPKPIKNINNPNIPKSALKSPTKVQSVAPHAMSQLPAPLRIPVKRIVSESLSPLSPTPHTLTRSPSNENSTFSPISTVPEIPSPLTNSFSNPNHIPLVSLPNLTSNKRARTSIAQANSPTNIQPKTLTNKSIVKPSTRQANTSTNKQLVKATSRTNSPTNIQPNTVTNNQPHKQPSITQPSTPTGTQSKFPKNTSQPKLGVNSRTNLRLTRTLSNPPIETRSDSPTNPNTAKQTNNTQNPANNPENTSTKPQASVQPGKQSLPTNRQKNSPNRSIQTNLPASPRASTKGSSIAIPASRSDQQPRRKLFVPKQSSYKSKGVDIVKPLSLCKINPRSSTLSLLLEEDSIITSSPESYIRFLDLETLKEKYCIEPKRLPGIIKKMEYRMSDQRLFVICGKKVNVSSILLVIILSLMHLQ